MGLFIIRCVMTFRVSQKIWIVAISMFAMLFSTLSSSAPIMSFEMMDASAMHHSQSACNMPMKSNLEDHSPVMMEECESEPSQHMCCDVMCMTVFALLNHYQPVHSTSSHLALIVRDDRSVPINQTSSLYRPPIA
ncbi:hypothetical protein AZ468_06880 [Vibrio europaeus]|uniref:Uncharacterized protein n=2 Tax=Vibrio europaeus TaxID=300876 RepID=A0A178JHD3_9VIBR|nr:hypothetical protein AZ468_06880 [Vibrio europaeus]